MYLPNPLFQRPYNRNGLADELSCTSSDVCEHVRSMSCFQGAHMKDRFVSSFIHDHLASEW